MTKKLLFIALFFTACTPPVIVRAQAPVIPTPRQQFLTNTGVVAAGYKLCTLAAGTTNNQATYSDSTLTTALPNPITLNSAGRPQTSGGSETAIYLTPVTYKFILYAAGTGNTCNGSSVGAQVWSQDNITAVPGVARLDCSIFPGSSAGAKISACITALPAAGGIADARAFSGSQTIGSDIFTGVTKNVSLLLGAATFSLSANTTIPANIGIDFTTHSILSPGMGATLTIHGPMTGPASQRFGVVGTVAIPSLFVTEIYPQWWGATGDGSDQTIALQAAITAAKPVGNTVRIPPGDYQISTLNLTNARAGFQLIGAGPDQGTRLLANTSTVNVLDCTGSRNIRLKDFALLSASTSIHAKTGILIASSMVQDGTVPILENLYVDVQSTVATIFIYAATEGSMKSVKAYSRDSSASPVVKFSDDNSDGLTSDFTTIVAGTASPAGWIITSSEFHDFTDLANGRVMVLRGMGNLWFQGVISASNTNSNTAAFIEFQNDTRNITFTDTTFYADSGHTVTSLMRAGSGITVRDIQVTYSRLQYTSNTFTGGGIFQGIAFDHNSLTMFSQTLSNIAAVGTSFSGNIERIIDLNNTQMPTVWMGPAVTTLVTTNVMAAASIVLAGGSGGNLYPTIDSANNLVAPTVIVASNTGSTPTVVIQANTGGINAIISATTGGASALPLALLGETLLSRVCTPGSCLTPNTGTTLTVSGTTNGTAPSVSGLSSPPLVHMIAADLTAPIILVDTFSTNSAYQLRRANGTASSPSAVQSGETLGQMGGSGYGASGYSTTRAAINFSTTENWTNTAQGTAVGIFTTTTGSTSTLLRTTVKDGLIVGSPTGDDKGVGTINVATNIYLNNTAYANPDFVLEYWAKGRIDKFKNNPGAQGYTGPISLKDIEAFAKQNYYLPQLDHYGIHDKPAGLKERNDASLMLHEETFIHLIDHEKRLEAIERRLRGYDFPLGRVQ